MNSIVQDMRFALRGLRRSPGFVLTAVATLAIGIGVNAAVFTVTKAALFAGFPMVRENDRLLYLTTTRYCCVSYPDFEDWRTQAKSFQGMAMVEGLQKTLTDHSGFPEIYSVTDVSANTFQLVGQQPILGRDFTPSDESPGAPPVAILSYGFWERRYGRDAGIIGQTVRVNGISTTVIGVMPRWFSFPETQDLWMPMVRTSERSKRDNRESWFVFGRMADGASIESARTEMATIGKRLEAAYPQTDRAIVPEVRSFRDFFLDPNETLLYVSMLGAVAFVLLIACANLANLMLARAIGRAREISIRIALGSGRWRVIRQLLLESALLSTLGGLAGLVDCKMGGSGVRTCSDPVSLESARLQHGLSCSRLPRRDLGGDGNFVRAGSGSEALKTGRLCDCEGGRPGRNWGQGWKSFIGPPGHGRNGAGRNSPGGSGLDDPQLLEHLYREYRRRSKQCPGSRVGAAASKISRCAGSELVCGSPQNGARDRSGSGIDLDGERASHWARHAASV